MHLNPPIEKKSAADLARATGRLAALRAAAALMGVAGGFLNMVMSFRKMKDAKERGEDLAYISYYFSTVAFLINGSVMMLTYSNFLTGGGVNLAIGELTRSVSKKILSLGVQRAVLMRIVQMSTVELVASVGGMVSGAGWVFLILGTAATVHAIVSERTALQKWVASSYFGGNEKVRFNSQEEEEMEINKLLHATSVKQKTESDISIEMAISRSSQA